MSTLPITWAALWRTPTVKRTPMATAVYDFELYDREKELMQNATNTTVPLTLSGASLFFTLSLGSISSPGDSPTLLPDSVIEYAEPAESITHVVPAEALNFLEFNHELKPQGTVAVDAVAGRLPDQDWDY